MPSGKKNRNGTVNKYRARVVALSYIQNGPEVAEMISSVVGFTSVQIILLIAALNKYTLHQMDVSNAFRREKLAQSLYMVQSKEFEETLQENLVCKLQNSVYSVKQAPRIGIINLNAAWRASAVFFTSLRLQSCQD